MLEIERISCSRAFHNLHPLIGNDLSPKVALVRKDGRSSRRPLEDDLNLYAPGILTEIRTLEINWRLPVNGLERQEQNLVIDPLTSSQGSSHKKGVT